MQKNSLKYPVELSEDVFAEQNSALAEVLKKVTGSESPRVLIVADGNVVQRTDGLGTKIGRYFQTHGIELAASPVVLACGEKVKLDDLQSALKIVTAILAARLEVTDCLLAIGGGSLLDVAGYAASQARGGVKVVRLPTTLAAMTDGAFAEYAAVDSTSVKDAMRVSSVPAAVVVDPLFAVTVLEGVWNAGFAEVVRQAVANDSALFKKLDKYVEPYLARDIKAIKELVGLAVASRTKKGAADLGLWGAMRLEAMSGYKLPHGYAVPIGLLIDVEYAAKKGLLDEGSAVAVRSLLERSASLDGLQHSQHLISRAAEVVYGLDAWRLANGAPDIALPTAIGKTKAEAEPDRAVMVEVIKSLLASHKETPPKNMV